MLQDTLNLVRLARQCAIENGRTEQAEKLGPVVNDLNKIVESNNTISCEKSDNCSGLTGDEGFQTLLNVASTRHSSTSTSSSMTTNDRNKIVVAMAAGEMDEIDIARRMGMTRDEVRLVIATNQNKIDHREM